MSKMDIGRKVPDFALPATGQRRIRLSKLKGHNVVLYFYPKDNTSGCTLEGQDFTKLHGQFKRRHTVVLGISRDSLESHEKFRSKYRFPFELLSDEDEKVCGLFNVIREKSLYGRKFMGIERSTFLIDAKGILRAEWRKVKVKGHAQAVLDTLKALD